MELTRPIQAISIGVAALLAVGLFTWRFCGEVQLPAKSPKPEIAMRDVKSIIDRNNAMPQTWLTFLDKDAAAAGLKAPNASEMRRAFPYQSDDTPRNLKVGGSFSTAGLTISLGIQTIDAQRVAVLTVANEDARAKIFRIVSSSNYGNAACGQSSAIFESRTAVLGKSKVSRNECTGQSDLALDIARVEVLTVPDLAAYYVSRVPATVFGMEHRLARDHKPLLGGAPCSVVLGSAIRVGFENGTITWRDLADFYARHRCDTYQFPANYRAHQGEGEADLPAVAPN